MIRSNFVLAALCLTAALAPASADTLVTLPEHIPFNAYRQEFSLRGEAKWKFQGGTYRIRHEASDRMLARLGKTLRPWDLSKVETREVAPGKAEIPGAEYLGEMLVVVFRKGVPSEVGRIELYGKNTTVPEVYGPAGMYLAPDALSMKGPGEQVTHLKLSSGFSWKTLQTLAKERITQFEKANPVGFDEGESSVAVEPAPAISPVASGEDDSLLGMGGAGSGGRGPASGSEGGFDAARLLGAVASIVQALN